MLPRVEFKRVYNKPMYFQYFTGQPDGTSEFTGCGNKPHGIYKKSYEMYAI